MSSSSCVSSNLSNNRYPPVSLLNLPTTANNLTRSLSAATTPTSRSPVIFSPEWPSNSAPSNQAHFYSNTSFFPRPLTPRSNEFASVEQNEIDQDFLHTFNIVQNDTENASTLSK
jgi:hypothetical protein